MRRFFLPLALILCLVLNTASAKMSLSIKGLSGALEANVDARLSLLDEHKISDTPYFKRYLESEIKKALRALGYYAPTFNYSLSNSGNQLIVNVDPGQPVLIEQVDVKISGQGEQDPDFIALLDKDLLPVGTILNHGEYDSFKKKLQGLALRKGYFNAEMTKNQLAVADKLHEAFWRIDFNTGARYKFGDVSFSESPIHESYLRNIVPFDKDEPYTSEKLSLLNRRLSSTNWFSSVTVVPLFNQATDEHELPVRVITVPRKKNIIDVGLGYSSDNGIRGTLGWNKPWLNDRGHSLHANMALSKPEQSITAAYKIPLYKSPLEDYYTIQGGYKKIDNNDTDSISYTMSALRNRDSFEGWQRSLGLNVMLDNFTQASDSYKTFLLYPSLSFSRIRSDDSLFPLWGDSQRYSIELASKNVGSDIDFIRFQLQEVWIRSIEERHRFIARANFGMIQANSFERVPPSFRFFAGGDRSIRGYGYQSISPKDSNGQLLGASKLITGTLEYQYNVTGAWWGAAFVDSGEAVDKFDKTNFYTGAGVGVRWVSPVGPIKLDIATPVNKPNKSIHFYIGLGAEL